MTTPASAQADAPEIAKEDAAEAEGAESARAEEASPRPVQLGMPGNALAGPAPSAARAEARDRAAPEPMERAALPTREPLLIYTATLTLAVFGVNDALEAVDRLARDAGGYLLERNDTSITIRIPAARFRSTLDGIGKVGDELHRQVHAREVTDEYRDLEIRLRNAEVMRQRLEVLLAKTGSISDALAVERELERVAQNIEQIKGRLKLLSELIAFSTISVNFQPRAVTRTHTSVELPFEFLRQLGLNPLLTL
jgi:hypothetical protein